jgi:hypothetical protein
MIWPYEPITWGNYWTSTGDVVGEILTYTDDTKGLVQPVLTGDCNSKPVRINYCFIPRGDCLPLHQFVISFKFRFDFRQCDPLQVIR